MNIVKLLTQKIEKWRLPLCFLFRFYSRNENDTKDQKKKPHVNFWVDVYQDTFDFNFKPITADRKHTNLGVRGHTGAHDGLKGINEPVDAFCLFCKDKPLNQRGLIVTLWTGSCSQRWNRCRASSLTTANWWKPCLRPEWASSNIKEQVKQLWELRRC